MPVVPNVKRKWNYAARGMEQPLPVYAAIVKSATISLNAETKRKILKHPSKMFHAI